ncbi:MAG: MaoC family dehydratase [Euryarchaeota archaeon]|nr:MaoC family dehydratase [Euryarchaeota archaeon]
MKPALTGTGNHFEDFQVGETRVHSRGRTLGDTEHIAFTSQVLNTAQLHFNQALADTDPNLKAQFQGRRPIVGTYVLAVLMGLSTPDTTENALAITRLREARHTAGVFTGDTLFAKTQVIEKKDDQKDSGLVTFKLTGTKQDRKTMVCEAAYEARVKKRPRA